jgi:trigger factor
MQVTKEQVDPCTVSLEIEVDAEAIERAYDRAYREFAGVTRVPGFRPGKAPRNILERYVDAERVTERVTELVAGRAYHDALIQEEITPYDDPEVDLPAITLGEAYRFKASVPLAPQITLGDYSDLTVERPIFTVTDADVDAQVERLRAEHARLAQVQDRGVRDGDILIAEVATTLEGEEPAEPTRSLIRMGDNIPGFDLSVTGQTVDEERTFKLKFPDDYEDPERAGKQATFYVKIVSINERILPSLDNAWVSSVTPFQTVDELREGVREQIVLETTRTSEEVALNRVVQALVEKSTIAFPQIMVQHEVERDLSRLGAKLEEQGASYDDYLTHNKLTQEEHRAQLIERAEDRVRSRLVLRELADKENLMISDEDVDSELGKILDENAIESRDARRLMKSERYRSQVTSKITQQKLNDLLRSIATMKDVPIKEDEPVAASA